MFGSAFLAVVAAIFFHLSIIRQDIEFLILHLGVLYIAVFCAITIVLSGHVRFTTAVVQTTGLAVVFNTTLMASVLAHRLFFHRIRKFPGPVGARVSKLWQVHKVWGNLQAYQLFDKAHKEYGDFVRIGMLQCAYRVFISGESNGTRFSRSVEI